ncbi:von Willebrand factor type A domain-containing protein [Myxococcus sp. AM011]|uniref:YfbK domain-containing protein n=1 Tax=Myxococcus sp. AM011 TaxID=2745200 RepID=UPI001595F125|nr:von Willebrand factor type A domain-containing protein [Myxococcus sp. AM011]NVJ20240.1 von Willebrand factor type A domain-containing protein [Myxococcus sp. AM011]
MKLFNRGVLCGLLLLFALPAVAQVATGTLIGTVIDSRSHKPVVDVKVTGTSPQQPGSWVAVTDTWGSYRMTTLPPGVYTLRFAGKQFHPGIRHQVRVKAGRIQRADASLLPEDSRGEGVEVVSTAPPSTRQIIDVGSTMTGVSMSEEFVKRIAVARPGARGGPSRSHASNTSNEEYGVPVANPGPISPNIPNTSYGIGPAGLVESRRAYGVNGPPPATRVGHASVPTPPAATPVGPASVPTPPVATTVTLAVPVSPAPEAPATLIPPNGARFLDMYFKGHGVNPTVNTEEERFSTFSVDTDTASYTLTRAYLERQALPDEQGVRVEEFVNTFDYGYADAKDAPFGIHVEGFPSPVRKGYQVVRIGVKAREVSDAQRMPSHLVFVIDVSGSMDLENRLGLVKRALRMLVEELDERDFVSIVVYGSQARQVLAPTSATQQDRLLAAIDGLYSEGSTNAQEGLELGYRIASEHRLKGGINRVILCSDGVANVGVSDADGLWAKVKDFAAQGITLSTVGFGMGNYNDALMERLSHVGEGNYAYVDGLKEAHRIFVQNLTGTLQVVAKDVKLQVEFDPKDVSLYRLLGYENRMLTKQAFRDDRVDAGEVGAGHSVTALYEVKPREGASNLGTLRIRYKAPEGGDSKELETKLPVTALRSSFARAEPTTRLAYVAAAFAEKLRGSYWTRPLTYDALLELWQGVGVALKEREDVSELGDLIRKASALDQREDRFESLAPLKSMDYDQAPSVL